MHLMVLKPVAVMRYIYKSLQLSKSLGKNGAQIAGYWND